MVVERKKDANRFTSCMHSAREALNLNLIFDDAGVDGGTKNEDRSIGVTGQPF